MVKHFKLDILVIVIYVFLGVLLSGIIMMFDDINRGFVIFGYSIIVLGIGIFLDQIEEFIIRRKGKKK